MTVEFNGRVILLPGNLYFSEQEHEIQTTLGSCVGITFWHPKLKIGGMCHFVLPKKESVHIGKEEPIDNEDQPGKYADDVFKYFVTKVKALGGKPKDYHCKMFGAMQPTAPTSLVAKQNVREAYALAKINGFKISEDLTGGKGFQKIIFNNSTGKIILHREEKKDVILQGDC